MKGLTDQKKKKNEKQVVCRRSASADFSLFFFSLILLSGHLSRGHQSWPQNKEKEYGRPRDLWKGIHLPLSFHFLARKWSARSFSKVEISQGLTLKETEWYFIWNLLKDWFPVQRLLIQRKEIVSFLLFLYS